MSGACASSLAHLHGAPVPGSGLDTSIRAAAGVTVVGLAGIAGAISYSHMRVLAAAHGETGWQAHAFPLSVDGIEIVASLVLLADRRLGRRSGWLPWAALVAGTAASLAANVAASGADPIGRVVAGWPAFALLVAVKLLSGMLEHRRGADRPGDTPDRPACIEDRPPVLGDDGDGPSLPARSASGPGYTGMDADPGTVPEGGMGAVQRPDPGTGSGTAVSMGTTIRIGGTSGNEQGTVKATTGSAGTVAGTGTGASTGTGRESSIAVLLPAARAARDRILDRGGTLTRDALAAQLRLDGHPVRNAQVSRLLTTLRHESCEVRAVPAVGELAKAGL